MIGRRRAGVGNQLKYWKITYISRCGSDDSSTRGLCFSKFRVKGEGIRFCRDENRVYRAVCFGLYPMLRLVKPFQ
jgi:hypothetical protein